jgi:hypothetical protein
MEYISNYVSFDEKKVAENANCWKKLQINRGMVIEKPEEFKNEIWHLKS